LVTGGGSSGNGAVVFTFVGSCPQPAGAPAVSRTGLLVLAILLAIGGMIVLSRRRAN
jgi:hypothetical protein